MVAAFQRVLQEAGALQVMAKQNNWIMYPCSADAQPLSKEEYFDALTQWHQAIKECAAEAREAALMAEKDHVLQQIWLDVEDDEEWHTYWMVLGVRSGMRLFEDKADAQGDDAEHMQGALAGLFIEGANVSPHSLNLL